MSESELTPDLINQMQQQSNKEIVANGLTPIQTKPSVLTLTKLETPITVLGQRILLQVKKFKLEDIEKIEGSILYAASVTKESVEAQTRRQTTALVIQIGTDAFCNKSLYPNGNPGIKEGDFVYFTRYDSQPIILKKQSPDVEYWVVSDKCILCKSSEDFINDI